MSTHLSATIICPHCGDRYQLTERQNSSGDIVRRGQCPNTPPQSSTPLWATEWELVRRTQAEVIPVTLPNEPHQEDDDGRTD